MALFNRTSMTSILSRADGVHDRFVETNARHFAISTIIVRCGPDWLAHLRDAAQGGCLVRGGNMR